MESAPNHWRVAAPLLYRCSGVVLRFAIVIVVALFVMATLALAQDGPVRGSATLAKAEGYARLVITLDQQVDAVVRISGQVLIVQFRKPVDVAVGKLPDGAPDYVTNARRDPDGTAIRFALTQKVTPNTIPAGEKLFVDLLPAGWTGLPPALPQEVVAELAARARAAEQQLREQRILNANRAKTAIRVRASSQPTFVRLSFDIAGDVNVTSDRQRDRLRLQFNAPINFDLADARIAAPSDITGMTQSSDADTATVEIAFRSGLDIRSFREDKSFVVDIGAPGALRAADSIAPALAAISAAPEPETAKPRVETDSAAGAIIAATKPEAPVSPSAPVRAPAPAPAPVAPAVAAPAVPAPGGATVVEANRTSDYLRLTFPFDGKTPAAMFRRGDTLWLVFDTTAPIVLDALARVAASPLADFSVLPLKQGRAVRLRLARPQLASLVAEDSHWTLTIADTVEPAPQPLLLMRGRQGNRSDAIIAFDSPGRLHRLSDPDSGETVAVITGASPARGFLKRQDLVDFRIMESGHGIVIRPNSDDLAIELGADRVTLSRPAGLTLSATQAPVVASGPALTRTLFNPALWEVNQQGSFGDRSNELVRAAAVADADKRTAARLELARFYVARSFYAEAKGVLDAAMEEAKPDDQDLLATHAVASILAGRVTEGLKSLDAPALRGGVHDAEVWRALALAAQEKWLEAREKFKNSEQMVATLPLDLQRVVLLSAARTFLNARDFSGATGRLHELRVVGTPPELAPRIAVLRGRLAEALGRDADASLDYAEAMHSSDRAAAAEATLRDVAMRQRRNEIERDELISTLETLAVTWRGDAVEIEALSILAKQYIALNRYRDTFAVTRTATLLEPNAELVRQMQDDASALFVELFLGGKADEMPPVDALGLFYEYRDLTPIGRRGDEMIRRLADRLVGVDLLEQASELLQYQVDHRLEGSARAQVAARLAMVYLMNRKPDRAIAALHATRISDLAGELRLQRLLLEGRAQSDVGRTDLALDIIANIGGREAIRLRSDIYWKAKRWREAAEQIEVLYGERWKGFQPLAPSEKADILRAGIGYALSEDALGISRLREKYAAKFDAAADRATFDLATTPAAGNAAELSRLAKIAGAVDTLDGFLRDIRTRFADAANRSPQRPDSDRDDPASTGSLPRVPLKAIPVKR